MAHCFSGVGASIRSLALFVDDMANSTCLLNCHQDVVSVSHKHLSIVSRRLSLVSKDDYIGSS